MAHRQGVRGSTHVRMDVAAGQSRPVGQSPVRECVIATSVSIGALTRTSRERQNQEGLPPHPSPRGPHPSLPGTSTVARSPPAASTASRRFLTTSQAIARTGASEGDALPAASTTVGHTSR